MTYSKLLKNINLIAKFCKICLHVFWKGSMKFVKYFKGGAAYKIWEPMLWAESTREATFSIIWLFFFCMLGPEVFWKSSRNPPPLTNTWPSVQEEALRFMPVTASNINNKSQKFSF
jgi:hypothetical protein